MIDNLRILQIHIHMVQYNILYAIKTCLLISFCSHSINPNNGTCLVTCAVSLTCAPSTHIYVRMCIHTYVCIYVHYHQNITTYSCNYVFVHAILCVLCVYVCKLVYVCVL